MDDQVKHILRSAIHQEATDVHLVINRPPIFRIHGVLSTSDLPPLPPNELKKLIYGMLTDRQKKTYEEERDLDFSLFGVDEGNFRVNVYHEKGHEAATFRIIPSSIQSEEVLNLPNEVTKLANKRKGIIIFAGSAGSGKTTSMTYLINLINNNQKRKIVTIEDPIEYVHVSNKSLIVQREVGADTKSFASALKYSLRQDPDVVMVGEIRDLESISMALTTAETGHLVLTTVHSPDSIETINRIIDVYPAEKRDQIWLQLAENLVAVVAQILVPRSDKQGRVLVTEVLLATMPIRNMIRRGALIEIRGQLDTETNAGCHTFEACLSDLCRKGIISKETAKEYSNHPHNLKLG